MEKINIAELLKDCPKGMELDCLLFDNAILTKVANSDLNYPICIDSECGYSTWLTKYGQYVDIDDAKCVIFPKGKTTWEGFVPPIPNKFDITTLKPFDKVLARDSNKDKWNIDFFAHYRDSGEYQCMTFTKNQCIPYEGNEYLLGTTDDCDEYYKTWDEIEGIESSGHIR